MSVITTFVNRILKANVPKPIYGRWGMAYKPDQVDARIDLANEDHCGPCGTYALSKEKEKEKEKEKKNSNQRLSYEDAIKYGIMKRRRGFHSLVDQSNLLKISTPISNNLTLDYMAGLPEELSLEYLQTNNNGPDEDPDDDDEPPNKGASPVLVAASLLASYRVTKEQLNN